MTRKRVALFLLMFSASMVLAACGDDKDSEGSSGTSTGAGSTKLSGTINISGSSTVAPITTRVEEKFE